MTKTIFAAAVGLIATTTSVSAFATLRRGGASPRTYPTIRPDEEAFGGTSTAEEIANNRDDDCDASASLSASRRELLSLTTAFVAAAAAVGSSPPPATAFDNKISDKYDDRPKRRGPQPKDLGVTTRKDMIGEEYLGLKPCGPAPNCFCSTDDAEDDPEHGIPAWTWPSDDDAGKAFDELLATIEGYEPGQSGIDGGGFRVVSADRKGLYLYAQFESLKNGYIDDVEFAVVPSLSDGAFQVRSSSRVGYLDFGVNAKRLNSIAKGLRRKGWKAEGVDFGKHPDYSLQNGVSS